MTVDFFKKHPQWPLVFDIAATLHGNGFQAVLAGGCVRDALLGIEAQDLDVATNASPDMVEKLFPHVIAVGKSFGVCRVVGHGGQVEVATFREESDYRDGRHPEKIVYSTLEKDALRRDFTINAMFFDLKNGELIDNVGGQEDLKNKIIRTVGQAEDRFQEDHLRILRAARFSAQLDFKIDSATNEAAKKFSSKLDKISQERIQEECHKAFKSQKPHLFFEQGKLAGWLPMIFLKEMLEFRWDHLMKFFSLRLEEPSLGWAELGLCYLRSPSGKNGWEVLRNFLKEKKLSNQVQQQVLDILQAEVLWRSGELSDFIQFVRTGNLALAEAFWAREEKVAQGTSQFVENVAAFKKKYFVGGELPPPLVRGDDLKMAGFTEGPGLKAVLEKAYRHQLENPTASKAEILNVIKAN